MTARATTKKTPMKRTPTLQRYAVLRSPKSSERPSSSREEWFSCLPSCSNGSALPLQEYELVRWQLEFSLNATGLRSQRIHFFSLMQSAGATGVLSSSTTIIVGSTLVATGVITYFIADWIEKDYTVGEMEKHRSKILIGNSPASDDFVNAEFICGGVSEGYHCWVKRKWAIGFMEFRSKKVT